MPDQKNVKKPILSTKQTKFVKGIADGKKQRVAYKEAYDTKGSNAVVDVQASQLRKTPKVQEALLDLFGYEQTKQIVKNVHKLAISANDEKVQLDASKEWLNRALPNGDHSPNIQFNNIQITQKDKYDL
jgi:hypothetical protein